MEYGSASQYLRISDIVRNPKIGHSGILPISRSTFCAWVKDGKAPRPIKLSPRVTVWRLADILAFAESFSGGRP